MWVLNINTINTSIYSASPVAAESGQQWWGCGGQEWPEYAEGKKDVLIVRPFLGHFGKKNAILGFWHFLCQKSIDFSKTNII